MVQWSVSRYHLDMQPTPRNITAAAKLPALLVSNLVNIRYLTGLECSAGLLLITSRSMKLFVDGRYTEVAKKTVPSFVKVYDRATLQKSMKTIAQCGCESDTVTLDEFRMMKKKFKNTKFVQKRGIIEDFRRSKTPEELRKFRKAQKITGMLMARVSKALVPGVTEQGIAWKLEGWAREFGAEGLGFEPIVAFGTHSSRPHHHPTDRKLKKGNVVQIDVGAQYQGYCADQSAVFFTGKPTPKQQRVYDAVHLALCRAKEAVRPGATNHELDTIARNTLKEYGLEKYFTHSLGHGVGLEVHEGVTLSARASKQILKKHEIVTIEPGVYLPGQFGMRLEEEVVVC